MDTRLQSTDICTTHALANLLAILQEDKGGHGSNLELRRHLAQLINVDLDKAHILVFLAQLADLGSHRAAGPTPGCIEVHNGGAFGGECLENGEAVRASC